MSVHGEFTRSLENLISWAREVEPDSLESLQEDLEAARLDAQPDLSAAARAAWDALTPLSESARGHPRLAELAGHLLLHCAAILGRSPRDHPLGESD